MRKGREQKQVHGTTAGPGLCSSALYRYPSMGTLSITPTHVCTAKCWFRSILGFCCLARYGDPPAREKSGSLNKSNRQTTTSPVHDVCLQALKLCYCSALKQNTLHSPNWHTVCFRDSQLTNQIKSPCSLNLHNIFQQSTSVSFLTPLPLEETVIPSVLHSSVPNS